MLLKPTNPVRHQCLSCSSCHAFLVLYTCNHPLIQHRNLCASSDLVLNGTIASPWDLELEVQVTKLHTPISPYPHSLLLPIKIFFYLSLLRRPLAIRIPVKHQLVTLCIAHLNRGVREHSIGIPVNLVAGAIGDEKWGDAALVVVGVKALLDGEVEDGAG